jgi:hypothetical protein
MALYAMTLFLPASDDTEPPSADAQKRNAESLVDAADLGATIVSAYELHHAATATGVRGDAVTDGPFIDAKEVIAGFFVIDAPDLDTALAVAKVNPIHGWGGGIEVRPVRNGFPKAG